MTATIVGDFAVQVYGYREYLKQSVVRDLKTKYKRSVLGYVWTMLHPLCMMLILSVVFSRVMRIPMKDYAIFLFSGMLAWNYFNSTVMMSLHSIRANSQLFSQVPVPKYIFIMSLACSNLVNYVLAIVPLLLMMVILGRPIPITVLAFPLVILPIICVVTGVSLLVAISNVFFDDTMHLTEVILQALYFLSPILYHRDLIPGWLVQYVVFNPLFLQIEFMRGIFYDGVLPNANLFCLNFGGSLLVLLLGLWLFRRTEDKFLYFL